MPPKVTKQPKAPPIPRQPFSRINFLYQASLLLSLPKPTHSIEATNPNDIAHTPTTPATATAAATTTTTSTATATATPNPALSRFYINTLRSISMKSVLRLHPNIKRTMCKRCDAHLIPGVTSTIYSENRSKGGRKPWAEVLVVRCIGCGSVKRFPVGGGGRTGNHRNKERVRGGGEQGDGGVEKMEYRLWCDREDVVEGLVIGGGGGGGGDCGSAGAGTSTSAGGIGE